MNYPAAMRNGHQSNSGICQPGGVRLRYVNYDLLYDVVLGGSASRTDRVIVDTDADYLWWGVVANSQTGAFAVRWEDAERYRLSNDVIGNVNMPGTASRLWPVWPSIILPAGGEIRFDITERSGAGNTIQMVFRGAKRYLL